MKTPETADEITVTSLDGDVLTGYERQVAFNGDVMTQPEHRFAMDGRIDHFDVDHRNRGTAAPALPGCESLPAGVQTISRPHAANLPTPWRATPWDAPAPSPYR